MSKVLPIAKAMLICDVIITESGTNKKSLIGIFEKISAEVFPCKHYKLSVYVKFTNAEGTYGFRLELVDVTNNNVIGQGVIESLPVMERLASYELVFNLIGLEFKHPGLYEFRIFANDMLFGSKTFDVAYRKENECPA